MTFHALRYLLAIDEYPPAVDRNANDRCRASRFCVNARIHSTEKDQANEANTPAGKIGGSGAAVAAVGVQETRETRGTKGDSQNNACRYVKEPLRLPVAKKHGEAKNLNYWARITARPALAVPPPLALA